MNSTNKNFAYGAALSGVVLAGVPANGALVHLDIFVKQIDYNGTSLAPVFNALLAPGTFVGSFTAFNDTSGKSIGGTGGGISAWIPFPITYGSPITTGATPVSSYIGIPPFASGVFTFGFITALGQPGWIRMDLGVPGGPVTFIGAAYNDTPGSVILAGVPVPEPATTIALAGLASLAAGVGITKARRRRQEKKAAEAKA
ncbi:MAG: hypothetical protein AAFX93_14205 [Verrucomicrobiota bacterium]